ncbi:hypothetical protein DYB37_007741 [Aphanomyces astaci]|uniref:Uncharacterized protein n=1 Tax=Aphanomyces astaci TaxID=112090 RepID=A0A397EI63_APHAT|nr:hypothetical protein DYB31_016280 [Aphanomyces astaci]RHY96033.1 hypothetical protein DYB35_007106 [Aphanomyces astaci]RHZ03819.1 hypothetical protein DYB37_007741 [Aphanomyces astaci]
MPTCSRCDGNIGIFSKRRKCPQCMRRVCKECVGTKDDKVVASLNHHPGQHIAKNNPLMPIPSSSFSSSSSSHVLLSRPSSMPHLCPYGCRDIKGGASDDGHRFSNASDLADFPPRSPADKSPEASFCGDVGDLQGDTDPTPPSLKAEVFPVASTVEDRTVRFEQREVQTHRMVDAANGFLVSFWLCVLWSIVTSALTNRTLLTSPTGLGAGALLIGTLLSARYPRSTSSHAEVPE